MSASPATPAPTDDRAAAARSLVALLGDARARIVQALRRDGAVAVAGLAEELGISEVAVRRHLKLLVEDGFVVDEPAPSLEPRERGRPATRYRLTDDGRRLFPQRYDQLAGQMLEFLDAQQGQEGVRAFLRWRVEREVDALQDAVTAQDLHDRLQQLARALSDAGFDASVGHDGQAFTLTQEHCTIAEVARDHPEVCAYEAAAFSRVLGHDVTLRRRATLVGGASTCVCHVRPRPETSADPNDDGPAPSVGHPDPET